MTSVAFIGVGQMGRPMAGHVAAAGFDVAVFDASTEVAADVAHEIGGRLLVTPEDFSDREIIITMLPTSSIVASALFDDGIAAALPAHALIIDMSSSNPAETLDTAERLDALGLNLVDAPVSGGYSGAVDATLTIMLGGDDQITSPAIPVLESMSRAIIRTGPVGSAHAMKALNNVVAGATTLACFEALAAGRRFGLDEQTMVNVWNVSTARSFVTEIVMAKHVLPHTFDTNFSLPLYAKDVGVARDLVARAGIDAPIIEQVAASFAEARDALGNVDHSRIYDLLAEAPESEEIS